MHGDYDQVFETGRLITFPIRLLFGFVSDSLFAICYLLFAICYLLFALQVSETGRLVAFLVYAQGLPFLVCALTATIDATG